eukprot:4586618-Pleurochrysis_carterae.AAC.1
MRATIGAVSGNNDDDGNDDDDDINDGDNGDAGAGGATGISNDDDDDDDDKDDDDGDCGDCDDSDAECFATDRGSPVESCSALATAAADACVRRSASRAPTSDFCSFNITALCSSCAGDCEAPRAWPTGSGTGGGLADTAPLMLRARLPNSEVEKSEELPPGAAGDTGVTVVAAAATLGAARCWLALPLARGVLACGSPFADSGACACGGEAGAAWSTCCSSRNLLCTSAHSLALRFECCSASSA